MRGTLLAVAAVFLTGCGTSFFGADPGPARTEDRPIQAVSEVELATSGDLTLTTGDAPALRITAGENVIGELTSDVRGDRLTLGTRGSVGNLGDVRYELVLPAARLVQVSGSGTAHTTSPRALGTIVLDGSGEVRAEGLSSDDLTVELSGSGRVIVDGRAGRQRVELDGSGGYDARDLDSTDAEVTVSGSGTADVQVSGTLDAVVEGSGSITHGGGATVHSRVDGSGSVEER